MFRLWFALAGVAFVAHTGHAINAAAPSVGAGLMLGATLNIFCGKRSQQYVCIQCAAGRLRAQLQMLSRQFYIDMGGDSPAFEALRLTALWQDGYTSRD